jgi:hypothetical protein
MLAGELYDPLDPQLQMERERGRDPARMVRARPASAVRKSG